METKKRISLYLCGSIAKKHDISEYNWDDKTISELKTNISKHDSNIELLIVDPSVRSDKLSDAKSVFGRDLCAVSDVDIVLVDLRDKRGIGVGAELMFAKMKEKPTMTIGWLRENSNYDQKETKVLGVTIKNWIHPFVEELVDYKLYSIQDIALTIANFSKLDMKKSKTSIQECIQHYEQIYLSDDKPMQSVKQANSSK